MLLSGDQFENPTMPEWLFYNFQIAFKTRNKDFINGYQKLWEGLIIERRNVNA